MGQFNQTTDGWSSPNVDQNDNKGWGDDDQSPETNDRRWEKKGGYNDQNRRNQDNNADNSNQNNQEWSYLYIAQNYV